MKPIGFALLAGALLALTAPLGLAQYVVSAKSGTVNYTEGQVQLNGQDVESTLTHYPDIKEGSVLSTVDGRAEVLLTPGVTLRLGDHASLKMITNRLIDTRAELLSGNAVVEVDQIDKDTNVTIVVKDAAVSLPKIGIYHLSFDPAELKVFKGEAAVLADSETRLVGAGRTCPLGGTEVAVKKFETAGTDSLDNWSQRRSELMSMANISGASSMNSTGGVFPAAYSAGMGFGMPYLGCSGFSGLGYSGFGLSGLGLFPAMNYGSGLWTYNPWYDMFTYVPCMGMAYSPYGYGYFSPGVVRTVVSSPTSGTGVARRPPTHGPTHAPVTLARPSLARAVNGSHSLAFRGGTVITHAYSSASVGRSGFAGYGGGGASGGSAARGGYSGGASSFGGASSAVSAGHAGYSGGGGGGGAPAAGGGGHR